MSSVRMLPGNALSLLESGGEFFPAILAAIANAQSDIHLHTYMFKTDATGASITQALIAAAQRGVRVRLVLDGFGSRDFVERMQPLLDEHGILLRVFRREAGGLALRRGRLRRMHHKLLSIDGYIAFVGGINILDDIDAIAPEAPRLDYALRIEGPLVRQVVSVQEALWHRLGWALLHRRPAFEKLPTARTRPGSTRAALVIRDSLRHRNDIERAYLRAIRRARHEILIANAYFMPGRAFRQALLTAAARGVKVTLVLQGRVEYWLFHHACAALYPHLLAGGIRIVEYRKSLLHAKVAVVDDQWATVGSSNIDPFSLWLAREANVIVRDEEFAQHLRKRLMRAIEDGGIELSLANWSKRSRLERFFSWLAYGVFRWIVERVARPID